MLERDDLVTINYPPAKELDGHLAVIYCDHTTPNVATQSVVKMLEGPRKGRQYLFNNEELVPCGRLKKPQGQEW